MYIIDNIIIKQINVVIIKLIVYVKCSKRVKKTVARSGVVKGVFAVTLTLQAPA